MKKNRLINKTLFALGLSVIVFACSDDEGGDKGVSFAGIGSNTLEIDAETITIPLRGGTVTVDQITTGGTATEDVDYTIDDVTEEGIVITIIDDNDLEPQETIRLQIPSSQNAIHEVKIVNNCEDIENLYSKFFEARYLATEKYCDDPDGADNIVGTNDDCWYSYEVHFTQDELNPQKFYIDTFYGVSGRVAYVIIDIEAGTVTFPTQTPISPGNSGNIGLSSTLYVVDPCDSYMEFFINYDGGFDYRFERISDF